MLRSIKIAIAAAVAALQEKVLFVTTKGDRFAAVRENIAIVDVLHDGNQSRIVAYCRSETVVILPGSYLRIYAAEDGTIYVLKG